MKIAGIIAEYNPFHNGHLHHVRETLATSGCDAVIAVMSGNFVQRGEPAAFDKWARARMALASGVDAVFELPAFYALQSADWFAMGGVSVLEGVGADCLSFGSEAPDMRGLKALADVWAEEPDALREEIRQGLEAGKPHPRARAEALGNFLGNDASSALSHPNAVLGAMYLAALKRLGSRMEPLAVPRVKAAYHDTEIHGAIASATAVRNAIVKRGEWQRAVPEATLRIVLEEMEHGTGPVSPAMFDAMALYALRAGHALPDAAEGLDNRMRKAAYACGTLEAFWAASKSKRYTLARIKRASMQALLGITQDDIALIRAERPVYARLLGYSRRTEGLVGELTRRAKIPFITRSAQYRPEGEAAKRLWEIDLMASDVYALACPNPNSRNGKRDFTEKIIITD